MKPLLILASSSRYRRELLDRLCLPYESISPDVDESAQPGETPRETALRLAELKARAVWNQHPGSVVIGSDQTADLHGVRLGKPHTRENAVKQLSAMQGEETVFATASDDPTSLIGLPLMKLTTLLKEAGIEVLPGL